ncbi:DNA gyrase subunit A [Candidatus Providencia siddallii]|uniref:DNA gyrase subunit A n=1 Tax=Candidatus Providencia siddallii TaxID=1715285 RepID=A0A0M6W6M3_9GAMM|nr:DNA gyrase subunit A [Candidatus Providencia siddallii]
MNEIAKEVTLVAIDEELKKSYLDYAISVIVGRALPDVRDGLKPVHRRILFAMNILGNHWDKPYKKSARIVGDVIGKYHPHGDSAVYETIVRLAQPFSMRYILVDGQGNFGSVDGDSAAAMRYTEIRMAKIAYEILADLEKETVNFIPNYDDSEKIPEVMPTKIPNLLINGASGIAVGMATNIPPHNLGEVINACLAYIDDENISIKRLMNHIPGPDFPTAGIINGNSGIIDAYNTGRGKIYIRARAEVCIDKKTSKETIIINEIPYQVNKARLIEKIADLIKEKRIEGISALRDESDKDGMRIVIEIKRDASGEVILNNLYSLTQLQVSFGINMVALHKGQPKILNLKDIISSFINHRREIIMKRSIFELNKIRNRTHLLEAFAIVLKNIDFIIELICNASTPSEAKTKIMSKHWNINNIIDVLKCEYNDITNFNNFPKLECNKKNNVYLLSEQQTDAILDLRLQKLTGLEHKKILEEYHILIKKIKDLLLILKDPKDLMNVIKTELKAIRNEYNDIRRTELIEKKTDFQIENLINQENVVVTLSHQGYVKYQPLSDYEAQRRGGKGKSAARIKEKDFIEQLLVANTHDTIICFSNRGRLYWMKIYQLPESTRYSRGRPIVNLIPLETNERITAILPVPEYKDGYYVFMATANGIVKKTALRDFGRPRSSGIVAVKLNDGDELIGVNLTNGVNEVMLFSAKGKVVRFAENTVRPMGRVSIGIRGIKLFLEDKVVSLIIPSNKGHILTVTEKGYGKRTEEIKYPIKSRATQGVISIKVSKRNGNVIGAIQVDESDQIMIITDVGTLVRIRVSEVNVIGRNTQGVTLIKTAENEKVVGLQKVNEKTNERDSIKLI